MTPLPQINPKGVYLLSGQTLEQLVRCIEERTPLEGPGVTITRLKQGFYWAGNNLAWKFPFRIDLVPRGWTCQLGLVWVNGHRVVPTYDDAGSPALGSEHVMDDYVPPTTLQFRSWWLRISMSGSVPASAQVVFGNEPPDSTLGQVNVWLATITEFDDEPVQLTGGTLQLYVWDDDGLRVSSESF